jgi:hypothetical protein
MKGNDMSNVGNIQFGPFTHPWHGGIAPVTYGPIPTMDNATLILTPAQEKEIEERMKVYNQKKEAVEATAPKPEVGTPVWVRDYRTRDGGLFNGWGLVLGASNHSDFIAVVIPHNGSPLTISTKDYFFEKPMKEIKKESFVDDDGQAIEVSYGEYETEDGNAMILGIDTQFEAVSFSLKNLQPLIGALQKVNQ